MTEIERKDRCRGCLVGGAVGDAMGYPVEFVGSFGQIRDRYGDNGIEGYVISSGGPGEYAKALISDDTQMSLYTAEGLLEAERNQQPILPAICYAYLAWYGPQVGRKIRIPYDSRLLKIDELNRRRAPGMTCLSALSAIQSGKEVVNDSKGCGGIMRVAPLGIYGACHDWPLEKTARLAGEVARLTHLHPLSTYSSAALAAIVQLSLTAEVIDSGCFRDIVRKALEITVSVYGPSAPAMEAFKKIIGNALGAEKSPLRDWEIIENDLGGGWVAEETLAIAIFSVTRHIDDFRACLVCAVNHGGDSDSTGAVAGNIIGAMLGYRAIPEDLIKDLQLHDLILGMADDLEGFIK